MIYKKYLTNEQLATLLGYKSYSSLRHSTAFKERINTINRVIKFLETKFTNNINELTNRNNELISRIEEVTKEITKQLTSLR